MSAALASPRGLWRAMTAADRAVCAAILAASLVAAFGARASSPDPQASAVVVVEGVERGRLPLARDQVATYEGSLGPVTVEVRGEAVAITHSTCPQHVCMSMGWKRRPGELITCVPNQLIVRVVGGGPRAGGPDAGPDAIVR
jgi:hypothetical protein